MEAFGLFNKMKQKNFFLKKKKNQNGDSKKPNFPAPPIRNILLHKQATLGKHSEPECISLLPYKFYGNF